MQGFKSKSLPPCYSYGPLVLQLRSTAAFQLEVRSSTEQQQCRGTMPGFAGSVAVTVPVCYRVLLVPALWQLLPESRRHRVQPGTRASATLTGKARLLALAKLLVIAKQKLGQTCKTDIGTGFYWGPVPVPRSSQGKPALDSWYWQNSNWAKHTNSPLLEGPSKETGFVTKQDK